MNRSQNTLWYVRAHTRVHISYCLILNEDVCYVLNILTEDTLLQKYLYKYPQEEIWHIQYNPIAI